MRRVTVWHGGRLGVGLWLIMKVAVPSFLGRELFRPDAGVLRGDSVHLLPAGCTRC